MNRARLETWLWLINRGSALLLVPLVAAHLAGMILAVRGGLSASEILERTRDNLLLAAFYGAFLLLAGLHGALGLRGFLAETLGWRSKSVDTAAAVLASLLVILGGRALWALYHAA